MFSGSAGLGWRDNIEVWGHRVQRVGSWVLTKALQEIMKTGGRGQLVSFNIVCLSIKIDILLSTLYMIHWHMFLCYLQCTGCCKISPINRLQHSTELNSSMILCSSGSCGNDMQMRTLNWWLSPRFVYLLCIRTKQYSSGRWGSNQK